MRSRSIWRPPRPVYPCCSPVEMAVTAFAVPGGSPQHGAPAGTRPGRERGREVRAGGRVGHIAGRQSRRVEGRWH